MIPPDDHSLKIIRSLQWVNINAFTAHLLSTTVLDDPILFALCTIHESLELPLNQEKLGGRKVADQAEVMNTDLITAAQYIKYGGPFLFRAPALEPTRFKGSTWNGVLGVNRERWSFWKSQFQQALDSDKLRDDLRPIIQETEKIMKEIEDGESSEI